MLAMNELIFLALCGCLVAGVICRPDRFLFAYVRRRDEERFPEPYLGEFVPAETPAQREQRESMARLRLLLKRAEEAR
jgi:hypothetical protein